MGALVEMLNVSNAARTRARAVDLPKGLIRAVLVCALSATVLACTSLSPWSAAMRRAGLSTFSIVRADSVMSTGLALAIEHFLEASTFNDTYGVSQTFSRLFDDDCTTASLGTICAIVSYESNGIADVHLGTPRTGSGLLVLFAPYGDDKWIPLIDGVYASDDTAPGTIDIGRFSDMNLLAGDWTYFAVLARGLMALSIDDNYLGTLYFGAFRWCDGPDDTNCDSVVPDTAVVQLGGRAHIQFTSLDSGIATGRVIDSNLPNHIAVGSAYLTFVSDGRAYLSYLYPSPDGNGRVPARVMMCGPIFAPLPMTPVRPCGAGSRRGN